MQPTVFFNEGVAFMGLAEQSLAELSEADKRTALQRSIEAFEMCLQRTGASESAVANDSSTRVSFGRCSWRERSWRERSRRGRRRGKR